MDGDNNHEVISNESGEQKKGPPNYSFHLITFLAGLILGIYAWSSFQDENESSKLNDDLSACRSLLEQQPDAQVSPENPPKKPIEAESRILRTRSPSMKDGTLLQPKPGKRLFIDPNTGAIVEVDEATEVIVLPEAIHEPIVIESGDVRETQEPPTSTQTPLAIPGEPELSPPTHTSEFLKSDTPERTKTTTRRTTPATAPSGSISKTVTPPTAGSTITPTKSQTTVTDKPTSTQGAAAGPSSTAPAVTPQSSGISAPSLAPTPAPSGSPSSTATSTTSAANPDFPTSGAAPPSGAIQGDQGETAQKSSVDGSPVPEEGRDPASGESKAQTIEAMVDQCVQDQIDFINRSANDEQKRKQSELIKRQCEYRMKQFF